MSELHITLREREVNRRELVGAGLRVEMISRLSQMMGMLLLFRSDGME